MPNDLQYESSPYLKQHQNNPIQWHAWSEATLAKAIKEQKPIFLSIGYSSCHWCHVMGKESFNDPDVAELINKDFIAIIVDKEERPDIDLMYMKAAQAISGHLGWPLNLFCTPEAKPYYAATYLPKSASKGMPGLMSIIPQAARVWTEKKEQVLEDASRVVEAVNELATFQKIELESSELQDSAFKDLKNLFDHQNGGFAASPKFPAPQQLLYLIKYAYQNSNQEAWDMAKRTLDNMSHKGLYDHVGGGFFRYSLDEKWEFPHFEKLLNDNALLAYTYTLAYKFSKDDNYRRIACETLTFIETNLKSDTALYHCSVDADTQGKEGAFYIWRPQEIFNALGPLDGIWFCELFDINPQGNMPSRDEFYHGWTHLLLRAPLSELLEADETETFEKCCKKLQEFRNKRMQPIVDSKKIVDWNALTSIAFIAAGDAFDKPEFTQKGIDILDEIIKLGPTSNLPHSITENIHSKDGISFNANLAHLDDYAYLAWALWEAHQSSLDSKWLEALDDTINSAMNLFWDGENGGFTFSQDTTLYIQAKEVFDTSYPSGNSIFAFLFQKMGHLTGEEMWYEYLNLIIHTPGKDLVDYPSAFTYLLNANLDRHTKQQELFVSPTPFEDFLDFYKKLKQSYLPNIAVYKMSHHGKDIASSQNYDRQNSNIYLCENFTCHQPWKTIEAPLAWLDMKNEYLKSFKFPTNINQENN